MFSRPTEIHPRTFRCYHRHSNFPFCAGNMDEFLLLAATACGHRLWFGGGCFCGCSHDDEMICDDYHHVQGVHYLDGGLYHIYQSDHGHIYPCLNDPFCFGHVYYVEILTYEVNVISFFFWMISGILYLDCLCGFLDFGLLVFCGDLMGIGCVWNVFVLCLYMYRN